MPESLFFKSSIYQSLITVVFFICNFFATADEDIPSFPACFAFFVVSTAFFCLFYKDYLENKYYEKTPKYICIDNQIYRHDFEKKDYVVNVEDITGEADKRLCISAPNVEKGPLILDGIHFSHFENDVYIAVVSREENDSITYKKVKEIQKKIDYLDASLKKK